MNVILFLIILIIFTRFYDSFAHNRYDTCKWLARYKTTHPWLPAWHPLALQQHFSCIRHCETIVVQNLCVWSMVRLLWSHQNVPSLWTNASLQLNWAQGCLGWTHQLIDCHELYFHVVFSCPFSIVGLIHFRSLTQAQYTYNQSDRTWEIYHNDLNSCSKLLEIHQIFPQLESRPTINILWPLTFDKPEDAGWRLDNFWE